MQADDRELAGEEFRVVQVPLMSALKKTLEGGRFVLAPAAVKLKTHAEKWVVIVSKTNERRANTFLLMLTMRFEREDEPGYVPQAGLDD